MNPFKPETKGPEAAIQDRLIVKLRGLEWVVMPTHGNMYQRGFPDLYCAHAKHRVRWIEVKRPKGYSFTPAQQQYFPLLHSRGVGIWVLTSDSDEEYLKLFKPANWLEYYLRWQQGIHY